MEMRIGIALDEVVSADGGGTRAQMGTGTRKRMEIGMGWGWKWQ